MKKILLIEPAYRNKYPPLALMKISTYHKKLGDEVFFVKGKNKELRDNKWDLIYITTLFTFHWNIVIDTVKYYLKAVSSPEQLKVGGIMASLLQDEIDKEVGIRPHFGIWKEIDALKPDYNLLKKFN